MEFQFRYHYHRLYNMAKKQTKTVKKVRKKNWYSITAPQLFNETTIGETLAYAPESLKGKQLWYNMMYLTGDVKSQNVTISFVIDDYAEGKAKTRMIGYKILPNSLKRLVRKNKDKIEDSAYYRTADNVMVRVKPFILTRRNSNYTIRNAVLTTTRKILADYFRKTNFEKFCQELSRKQVQKNIYMKVNKIFPIQMVEIREMRVAKETPKTKKLVLEFKEDANGSNQ